MTRAMTYEPKNTRVWEQAKALGFVAAPAHRWTGSPCVIAPDANAIAALIDVDDQTRRFAASHAGEDWSGSSLNDNLEMARIGWAKGAEQVGSFDVTKLPFAYEVPDTIYDVTGGWVDVGAFLSGEPECMGDLAPTHKPQSAIQVVIDLGVSGGISHEWIMKRATSIARLVLSLVRADIPVEVTALSICSPGKPMTLEIPVFRPGYTLSLGQIAYWMGHPGAIRAMAYMAQEALGDSYGYLGWDTAGAANMDRIAAEQGFLYIPRTMSYQRDGGDIAELERQWEATVNAKIRGA